MITVDSADASELAATSRGGALAGQSMIDRDRERFVCSDMAMK